MRCTSIAKTPFSSALVPLLVVWMLAPAMGKPVVASITLPLLVSFCESPIKAAARQTSSITIFFIQIDLQILVMRRNDGWAAAGKNIKPAVVFRKPTAKAIYPTHPVAAAVDGLVAVCKSTTAVCCLVIRLLILQLHLLLPVCGIQTSCYF